MKYVNKQHEIYQNAIDEAKRFLKRAEAVVKELKTNPRISNYNKVKYVFEVSRELTASAKRASMDLTKALVKIRK